MRLTIIYQSQMTDLGLIVISASSENFRFQHQYEEHQRKIFRSVFVFHLIKLIWKNRMTVRFDDFPWINHMSVKLAKVVEKQEGVLSLSSWELVQTYELRRSQKNIWVWVFYFYAKWQFFIFKFIQSRYFSTFVRFLVKTPIFCSLCFRCRKKATGKPSMYA